MTALAELIARVEKASGADRQIDAEIMFDLFARPVGKSEADGGPSGYLWPEDNPSWSFGIRFPGKDKEWFTSARRKVDGETLLIHRDGAWVLMNSLRIPHLTSSIDAAIALVEKRFPNANAIGFDQMGAGKGYDAYVSRNYVKDRAEAYLFEGTGKTIPLAFLAALLKAEIKRAR